MLGLSTKDPIPQTEQIWSAELVPGVVIYSPAAQAVTGVQLAALVVVEKLVSAVHEEQSRLVVAVGAVETYSPATQVASVSQTRSLEAVGATVSYSVPVQVVTAVQLSAFVTVE